MCETTPIVSNDDPAYIDDIIGDISTMGGASSEWVSFMKTSGLWDGVF
jgi:hypothetical protein